MRVDTTVVETNIHHPTDSTLLGDGVRVLTRTMKKITDIAGAVGTRLRDRSRGVKLRLLEIGRIARAKGPLNHERLKQGYRRLLDPTSRVVGQAKRFSAEISSGVKRSRNILKQLHCRGSARSWKRCCSLVRQVMRQTRQRIFHGNTRAEGKLLSLFEPSTEIIRKGKAGKPNEFGKVAKLQEAENQIVVDYQVYDRRPGDSDLLISSIESHQALLARVPRLVAADAGFYSAGMRRPQKPWASSASVFPIARPRARNADASRKSAGSAMARNGGPDPKAVSVWSSADMALIVADTGASTECSVGSASASSPTTSSTSGALWKSAAPKSYPPPHLVGPAGLPAGFALSAIIDHNAANINFAPGSS